jgi:hypothetical protein
MKWLFQPGKETWFIFTFENCNNLNYSSIQSLIHSFSQLVGQLVSRSVGQSVSRSIGPLISQSFRLSIFPSVRLSNCLSWKTAERQIVKRRKVWKDRMMDRFEKLDFCPMMKSTNLSFNAQRIHSFQSPNPQKWLFTPLFAFVRYPCHAHLPQFYVALAAYFSFLPGQNSITHLL